MASRVQAEPLEESPVLSPKPSNFVVVMSDQHRADMMCCAGDEAMLTASIDRLAAEGVRFSRVSCQGPLCMPARASFMTERYVRDHGVYTNWSEIDRRWPTYVRALRDAGYHTALLGKAHLYRDEGVRAAHIDELAPRLMDLGFCEVLETSDKFLGDIPNRYSDYLEGQGLLDIYRDHLAVRSYQGENETGRNATKSVPMWDSTPLPIPLSSYIDFWHGLEAARWIESYEREEPFFLFVGFPGPHDPWDAPREAVDRYRGIDISMPASTRRPRLEDTGRYRALLESFLWLSDTETMTPEAIRGMRRAYAADITVIDEAIGNMISALESRSLLDSTWFVYTSDHGEMAGNHGFMSKCVLYEPAVRVPLVVRPPGGCRPRVVEALVEHFDLPATLREVAGAPAVELSEGQSLARVFEGGDADERKVSISENWGFASFETDRYRLVVDEDAVTPCQLFDLLEDPAEDHDLLSDPQASGVVHGLMDEHVRPFLRSKPARPTPSIFTG